MSRALFVFALSDPALLPLLGALGRSDDLALYLVPGNLVADLRATGVRAHHAFDLLDAAAATRIEEQGRRFSEALAARSATLARHFGGPDDPLWRRLHEPLAARLHNVHVTAEAAREMLERLAASHGLAAALLGFDTVPVARAVVATARRLGVPTIHLPHGILGRPRLALPWQGARMFADLVCAQGEFSRAGYLKGGADPARVRVTGCPRWDEYAGLTPAHRHAMREAIAAPLRLDPRRPIVVFGPSWVERQTANAARFRSLGLFVYRQVLAAVRRHADAGVQLVVKLHPGELTRPGMEPNALVDGYLAVARRAGLAQVTVTSEYKRELLAVADAVVVVNSNLGIEALLCERPVINVPLDPADADALFTAGEGIVALTSPEGTAEALDRVLADEALRQRLAAHALGAVRPLVDRPDGRASERVAAVVLAAARGERREAAA